MQNVRKPFKALIARWPNCATLTLLLDNLSPNAERTVLTPEIATKTVPKARKLVIHAVNDLPRYVNENQNKVLIYSSETVHDENSVGIFKLVLVFLSFWFWQFYAGCSSTQREKNWEFETDQV